MGNDSDRKDLLLGFLREVWNEGRVECAADFIAPRYTIHHDPGDPWEGQELDITKFKERVLVSRAPFPDQQFEVQELFATGDAVLVTWQWVGTHKGDLPGFPASGKRVKTSGATVFYFEGDSIAGHWQVVDRLSIVQQLQAAR